MRPDWDQLRPVIKAEAGISLPDLPDTQPVGGGDINDSFRVGSDHQHHFLKLNDVSALPMFEAEADGLSAMSAVSEIRVPRVIAAGSGGAQSFLLLEWLDLVAGGECAEAALGRGLAALHRIRGDQFGWPSDNFIGRTVQQNAQNASWVDFYRDQRLAPQLKLAKRNGFDGRVQELGDELTAALPQILAGHEPEISLTHGDLWGGNRAWLADGTPVLFDPAICCADRETDLAMTRLFGGFGAPFYHAYNDVWSLSAGHEWRVGLYQLYHLLNHLNLFGSGYLRRCCDVMEKLLRDH